MTLPTSDNARTKLLRLVGEGVSLAAAARASGISPRTAGRIVSAAEDGGHPLVSTLRQGHLPFSGGAQDPPNIPPVNYSQDQPRPPPTELKFDPNYHGHTFTTFSAPVAFDGWSLKRARDAISMHRQGIFLESSMLAIVLLSFAPVLAALGQRLAPALALPRQIICANRGLSRILGAEIEEQIAPSNGLSPSPYFPPTLWGAMGFDLALPGFSWLQHAYGDEHPETGVRPLYTRRWPTWATQYVRSRRQFIAFTNDGPVDMVDGDGKWTLIADSEEPHFMGTIVALPEEVISGIFTKRALASYIDKYGNPKWVAEMPPGTGVRTAEGEAFFDAISTIRGPDGFGVIPNGAKVDIRGLVAGASTVIKDALESHWQYIAASLLGSDGTMTRGTGVYSAPIFAGVRRDLVDRDLRCMVRGTNSGHITPYLRFNYAQSIAAAKSWQSPYLDIPLPDPDADARIKSYSDRVLTFHKIIKEERSAGFEITQDRVEQLAKSLEITAPKLVVNQPGQKSLLLAPTDLAKVIRVDEARQRGAGLDPIGDERGMLTIAELDARAKAAGSETNRPNGETKPPADETDPADAETEGATTGPAALSTDATGGGGSSSGTDEPGNEPA